MTLKKPLKVCTFLISSLWVFTSVRTECGRWCVCFPRPSMWHNKKDTQVLHKHMNTVFALLCEVQLSHLPVNAWIPALARGGRGGIFVLYRFSANLDHVHGFRQLPHKPNNYFARGILNYVPSGWNEFCSWNLILINEVSVFYDTRWRLYFKGKFFRKLQNHYITFFNLNRQIY